MPTPEIDLHGHHWVNTIGHCAGIIVFATLFALIYRDARRARTRPRLLPLASTLLALGWDLALLFGLAVRTSSPFWANTSAAIAFACLSLLPAVLLDLGLLGRLPALRLAGYILGASCAVLHLIEIFLEGPDIHSAALIVLSAGFAGLAAISFVRLRKTSAAASLCLFLLSISFLHFRDAAEAHHLAREIVLHHAGIPIALFVVLRDYRFLLLDAFLRLAASGALASLFVGLLWQCRPWLARLTTSPDPFWFGIFLVLGALTLFAFAHARDQLQGWLTRRVFLRRDPQYLTHALANLDGDEAAVLDRAASLIATYFHADRGTVSLTPPTAPADAALPLRFLKGDEAWLCFSGRRFLSEDFEALDRLAPLLEREIDRARTRELERLMTRAELQALQAQIHPHFLFNALNALYGSIPRSAADARRLVLSLSEVLRYFLNTSRSTVRLEEELAIIEAYLEIEKARLGPRLSTRIVIPEDLRCVPIPLLSLEPLVENAIKHGIAPQPGPGILTLSAARQGPSVVLTVQDTGPGPLPAGSNDSNRVGLENVRRRLALHYGARATLDLTATANGACATLTLPLPDSQATMVTADERAHR